MSGGNMVLIGLGGNQSSPVGPPARTIAAALETLAARGWPVLACSPLYRTAPMPVSDQPWFVNAVARLAPPDDGGSPEALLDALLAVERRFGRVRGLANAARTLDLDLLAYGDALRETRTLVLPHPRLQLRAFVLRPLVDLAPGWRHPRLGRTARELLRDLPPGQVAERLEAGWPPDYTAGDREGSMAARGTPPFRAEHVGSLLRPSAVKQARDDLVAGHIDAPALRAIEDAAIRELVAMQQDVGLQVVTDGEIRRATWHMDFYYQIAGVLKMPEKVRIAFRNAGGDVEFSADAVTLGGKVRLEKTIFGEDFAFLRSVAKVVPKLTIPSPCVLHRTMLRQAGGGGIANAYADPAEFLSDLAAVYRDQIARLGALGCGYLQLDDTTFAGLCDPAGRDASSRAGADGEHLHLTYIRLMNEALKRRPAGMTVCTHTCRGNYRSAWYASGGYDFMAEALFSELDVDGFFLEYDDERSGGFEPLRFVPKGKTVVLGLVSSKLPALESKDMLKRRIDAAAKHLPLDQLCLSPQCGFSSTQEGNALTAEQQAAKLRLVVETAREVWG